MSKVDDVISLATPEAALRELRKAKEFWQSIKDLPLVDDIENSEVDWDALEAKLEATGLKLPFVYPKAARQADGQRAMTMEAAMQILQAWETQMVRAFVISPTKIGLGLIGGTGKMVLGGASAIVTILEAVFNPNRDKAVSYWEAALEFVKDGIAPLLIGSQFKVIKALFKGRPEPATKALPQSSAKRTRKKARTRIAHEVRAARR